MSSGSSSSSILNMPDYGQGLAEALQAQTDALSGTLTGTPLRQTLEQYERPLRMSAAQIDNDVLRQTLLGGWSPKFESAKSVNILPRSTTESGSTTTLIDYGGTVTTDGKVIVGDSEIDDAMSEFREIVASNPMGTVEQNQALVGALDTWFNKNKTYLDGLNGSELRSTLDHTSEFGKNYASNYDFFVDQGKSTGTAWYVSMIQGLNSQGNAYMTENISRFTDSFATPEPIYKKNADGTDFIVPKDDSGNFILETTNEAEIPAGGVAAEAGELVGYTRSGSGLVDMLGDTRNALDPTTGGLTNRQAGFDAEGNFLGLSALAEDIQRGNLSRQREADLADVERLDERYKTVMDEFRPGTKQALTDASAVLEAQKDTLTGAGALTVPSTSTYGGDITASQMTAATVADPLALSASTSYDPSASVSGGTFDADTSYTATAVADPMSLTAATSYDPSASVTGGGYTATAGLQGGNIGQDVFREALMTQATAALDNGLSERELASISNAARARSGLMGRTFDQQGAIDESKALVLEDQKRRMQNRAFAQQALGQEADIRERDLSRGLQASMQNQTALNRAAEFGASQSMQAQLANQAATNQALSQGLSAGLSQEALAAQQAQAKAMADATATNRASEFGVGAGLQQETQANQAGLQAQLANQQATNQAAQFGVGAGMEQDALAAQLAQQQKLAQAELNQQSATFNADAGQRASQLNQAQTQQASQFGVGATMDAQRLNEQLSQAGTLGYIDASSRLAALEDQYSLDPFAAILGRAGGGSLQAGQGIFGQAGYGLNSGPQYLNPESGLGYISQMATNNANMNAANTAANASKSAGMMGGLGSLGGGIIGGLIGLA